MASSAPQLLFRSLAPGVRAGSRPGTSSARIRALSDSVWIRSSSGCTSCWYRRRAPVRTLSRCTRATIRMTRTAVLVTPRASATTTRTDIERSLTAGRARTERGLCGTEGSAEGQGPGQPVVVLEQEVEADEVVHRQGRSVGPLLEVARLEQGV